MLCVNSSIQPARRCRATSQAGQYCTSVSKRTCATRPAASANRTDAHEQRLPAQPRAEAYDELRLLELSEAIRQLDRSLVQRIGDARLLKGETLADLAKSGAALTVSRVIMSAYRHGEQEGGPAKAGCLTARISVSRPCTASVLANLQMCRLRICKLSFADHLSSLACICGMLQSCRAGGAAAAGVRAGAVARDGAGRHAACCHGQDDGAAGQGHARGDEGTERLT